jgi:formyl-CoA transferase
MPENKTAPLDGIRVLDLSRILAGPTAAMILGDLGADVVKVENPDGGDDTRTFGPAFEKGESAYFMSANRNKRSILADLKTEEGQGIVRALAQVSDVVIENYRFGTLEKFGLGLDAMRERNPRLVTCSVSGYGRESPLAQRAGYDFVIQAEGGLMSIIGAPDGPPYRVGVAIADLITGNNAAQAVLAALYSREKTGKGQHVDMALLDCQVAALSNVAASYLMDGRKPGRYGNAHPAVAPYQLFETKDEPIALAVGNDRQFRTLCKLLGLDALAKDPRFATNAARLKHVAALVPPIAVKFQTAGREHWMKKLHAAGLPAGAIRTVDQVLDSPEVRARGMVEEMPHPALGTARLVASPLKLSETPVRESFHAPMLGEHTAEVLIEALGWTAADATNYAARLRRQD